jgi:hypothetical protein
LDYHPIGQSCVQKFDPLTEAATFPAVTELTRTGLQREDGVTPTMKTDAANLVSLDQGGPQTLTSRQKRRLPAARARADNGYLIMIAHDGGGSSEFEYIQPISPKRLSKFAFIVP